MGNKINKITEKTIDEKLNKENNYDIENADTLCPVCKNPKNRFWLAFYGGETLLVYRDCGYHQEI